MNSTNVYMLKFVKRYQTYHHYFVNIYFFHNFNSLLFEINIINSWDHWYVFSPSNFFEINILKNISLVTKQIYNLKY